jgi:hypothetical protein
MMQAVYSLKWAIISAGSAFFISIFLGIFSNVGVFHIFIRAFIFAIVFFGLGFGLRFIIDSFFPELLFSDEENEGEKGLDQSDPRVSVTIDNTGEYAVPELYKTAGDPHELGNIEDLISGVFKPHAVTATAPIGIDRKPEAGYNIIGRQSASDIIPDMGAIGFLQDQEAVGFQEKAVSESAPVEKPVFTPSFGGDSGLEGLPDLDMMARAFSPAYGGSPAVRVPAPEPPAPSFVPQEQAFTPSFLSSTEEVEQVRTNYTGNKPQPLKGDFNPKELAEGLRAVLAKEK